MNLVFETIKVLEIKTSFFRIKTFILKFNLIHILIFSK